MIFTRKVLPEPNYFKRTPALAAAGNGRTANKPCSTNFYFSINGKGEEERPEIGPYSFKCAGKNFLLDRMFEVATMEEIKREQSFRTTLIILGFTALSLLWGNGFLSSVLDNYPQWLTYRSKHSALFYGALGAMGLAGIYIFIRIKLKEMREIVRLALNKEDLIMKYLDLGETTIPRDIRESDQDTADHLQSKISKLLQLRNKKSENS
jgi:hypothetical protein